MLPDIIILEEFIVPEEVKSVLCIALADCFYANAIRKKGEFVDYVGDNDSIPAHLKPVDSADAAQVVIGEVTEDDASALSQVNDRSQKIYAAVMSLDADDDSCWTSTGIPSVEAVESALNDKSIKRDEIKTACPGYDRKEAKARQKK